MKNLNYITAGLSITIIMTFFIIGCASEPVKVDLPVNHPASPKSNETAFTPPPNPFQQHMPMTEHKAASKASMMNEEQPPAQQHQKTHQKPGMGHDSKPVKESEAANPEKQHKEHNQ